MNNKIIVVCHLNYSYRKPDYAKMADKDMPCIASHSRLYFPGTKHAKTGKNLEMEDITPSRKMLQRLRAKPKFKYDDKEISAHLLSENDEEE